MEWTKTVAAKVEWDDITPVNEVCPFSDIREGAVKDVTVKVEVPPTECGEPTSVDI